MELIIKRIKTAKKCLCLANFNVKLTVNGHPSKHTAISHRTRISALMRKKLRTTTVSTFGNSINRLSICKGVINYSQC
jgi:hypothetical protein